MKIFIAEKSLQDNTLWKITSHSFEDWVPVFMKEVLGIIIAAVLLILSTYSFSRALWLLGIRGKENSFRKLWLAVSCFFTSAVAAVGFVALVINL